MSDPFTDFGYQRVPASAKARMVLNVFDSVATRYDVMNDLMSWGVHRLWKRFALTQLGLRPGQRILDVAGGTGDMARLCRSRVGAQGWVVLADINRTMLEVGRDRLTNGNLLGVDYVQSDAEALSFRTGFFDAVVIAFGLRNVTRKELALAEMYRVLRPGGRLVILEFSTVALPWLRRLYDIYSFKLLPRLGAWVAGDSDSYRYLVESIRRHPDRRALAALLEKAGFERVDVHSVSGGIVAVHRGLKL